MFHRKSYAEKTPYAATRFKSNQLLKLEKENENKRKVKTMNKDRTPANPKLETVWDRLSKVKKSVSNETHVVAASRSRTLTHVVAASKSRTLLPTKCSHRTAAGHAPSQCTTKKSLSPGRNCKRRVTEKKSLRRVKPPKNPFLQDLEPIESTLVCRGRTSVKELLTARSMCDSKSSSEDSKVSGKTMSYPSSIYNHYILETLTAHGCEIVDSDLEDPMESRDSMEEFVIAPLIPVPTTDSLTESSHISSNFCCLLEEKNERMEPEEVRMIKNVLKTDGRHRRLHKDDSKLFKDILKTQLKEIIRQESVVKSALDKLDVPVNSSSTLALVTNAVTPDALQEKPQVDVIFKNVPTLEKEIIILKALGEKLEATLKRTSSPNEISFSSLNKLATTTSNLWCYCWNLNEQYALCEAYVFGLLQWNEEAREFLMVQKTIIELKEKANHHFYLPINKDAADLKRTSFKRLTENPDVLLKYLKPKNSLVPVRMLDQDPNFFSKLLCQAGATAAASSELSNDVPEASQGVLVKDVGDSLNSKRLPYKYEKEPLIIEEIPSAIQIKPCNGDNKIISQKLAIAIDTKPTLVTEDKCDRKGESIEPNNFEAPIRGKNRRRIRQCMTPLLKERDPKVSLFKKLLVGSMQLSLFLLLIMAFTYPDVKC